MDVTVLGVIENMSFLELPDGEMMDVFGQGGGEELAQDAGVPFLGAIPIDPAVRQGGDEGAPITVSKPDSPAAEALNAIATALLETLQAADPDTADGFDIEITD